MCSNYNPVAAERLEKFGFGRPDFSYSAECYPGQTAPFLANDRSQWQKGVFGLLPYWAKPALARKTYNARSETAANLPSFRNAWKHRRLAVIPVDAFFEPNYESGRPVRWRIEREDGQPFGLAGIWERRHGDNETEELSFSMLTTSLSEILCVRHTMSKEGNMYAEQKEGRYGDRGGIAADSDGMA